jgi:hypothetical protein
LAEKKMVCLHSDFVGVFPEVFDPNLSFRGVRFSAAAEKLRWFWAVGNLEVHCRYGSRGAFLAQQMRDVLSSEQMRVFLAESFLAIQPLIGPCSCLKLCLGQSVEFVRGDMILGGGELEKSGH